MIGTILDVLLIFFLIIGIIYAARLMKQLATLRSSRQDMEKFVIEFNATVMRADNTIKGLKQAARSSGDDLEQLIEKSQKIIDELTFLTDSADQIATRLSNTATSRASMGATYAEREVDTTPPAALKVVEPTAPERQRTPSIEGTSAAEKDLLKVLEKMG